MYDLGPGPGPGRLLLRKPHQSNHTSFLSISYYTKTTQKSCAYPLPGKLEMTRRRQQQHHQDHLSRMFYELSSIIFNLLRSPVPFSNEQPPAVAQLTRTTRAAAAAQITPAGFASLMLGVSIALILCGSVTFFIGFLLMPWVLGLLMVLYVVGIVSTISMFGRSLLCYALGPPRPPRKDIPAWKLLRRIGGSKR